MPSSLPVFQIEGSLLAEAGDILGARQKALVIHRTRDIDTAGDEVEIVARSVIAGKMPGKCMVTHGHVLDSRLTTSGQLDVIVADTKPYANKASRCCIGAGGRTEEAGDDVRQFLEPTQGT